MNRYVLVVCLAVMASCSVGPVTKPAPLRTLTVLYTNDEHGWMEGVSPEQGAAQLYQLWVEREAYTPEGSFLILSGGDNWTGPAVSTTVAGESMVEVMNAMHYSASAVGNHEFDFGLDVLRRRSDEANYPYLSANTTWRENRQVPTDLGIDPFTVVEVDNLRVGIIGLTTTSTPRTTFPDNVAALEFGDYEQTLRATVPQVRALGVDWLFVIAHVCIASMRELAIQVADLNVQMMGAGHCNELAAERIENTIVLGGGAHLQTYAKAVFHYLPTGNAIQQVEYSVHENQSGSADGTIAGIVQRWQQQVGSIMSVVIGYNAIELARPDPVLEQAIIDSWLLFDPLADVAVTNAGGIRAALPAGDITVGDVIGILPFDNTLIAVNLSGAALKQMLALGTRPIVAGLTRAGDEWLESAGGTALDEEKIYRVLVNSFMYAGGDNYGGIAEADPEGFDTGINYRQPFIDWIAARQSSRLLPLLFSH